MVRGKGQDGQKNPKLTHIKHLFIWRFFKKNSKYLFYVHESFTYTYVCALPVSLESVGQRMALDPSEPKLQMVVSQQMNAGN